MQVVLTMAKPELSNMELNTTEFFLALSGEQDVSTKCKVGRAGMKFIREMRRMDG